MKSVCKLELNNKLLDKAEKKEDLKLGRWVRKFCLNCGLEFGTAIDNQKIFCSGKCADYYNSKK